MDEEKVESQNRTESTLLQKVGSCILLTIAIGIYFVAVITETMN